MERTLAEEIKLHGSTEGLENITIEDIEVFYKEVVGNYPVVAIYHSIDGWKGNLIYKVGQRYVTTGEPNEMVAEYDIMYDIIHSASLEQIIEYIRTSIEYDGPATYKISCIREMGTTSEGQKESEDISKDDVNHPEHYTVGGIETIDILKAKLTAEEFKGFLKGNVIKYLCRANHKGKATQDIEKAQWYTNKLVEVDRGE